MTPEAMRVAIAEAQGIEVLFPGGVMGRKKGWGDGDWNMLPDYPNDLNAMYEAESTLTGHPMDENSQKSEYSEQLVLACTGEGDVDIWFWHQIHATAPQRAEAFLKTIGKWTE